MTEPDKPIDPGAATLGEVPNSDRERDSRTSQTDSWRFRGEGSESIGQAEALVGQLIADRFLVQGLLGQGGMGAVYRAEHVQLKKPIALKVLHRDMSASKEVVARFEREAVAAGRLDHPGIVSASDFGRLEDGSFYLALEYIDGRSLSDLLRQEGPLAPERALGIAYQIADALSAAHAEGIVHRDMKPDNVLVVRTEDEDDFVKVVDFGIAKVRLDEDHQEGLTRVGLVFGTPEYMSPEQAMGHVADARSDLYGVGMLLYEMLVGHSPFRADDVTAMLTAQIADPPPPLPEEIPWRLRQLAHHLLEKDPKERLQTARAVIEELSEIAHSYRMPLPPARNNAGMRIKITQKSNATGSLSRSLRSFSMRPVPIGNKSVPLWVPVLALLLGVVAGVAAMLANPEAVPILEMATEEEEQEQERIDSEAQLLVEAVSGDRDAIAELRKLAVLKQEELEKAGLISAAEKDPEQKPGADRSDESGRKGSEQEADAGATKDRSAETPTGSSERPASDEQAEAVSKQAQRYFVLGQGYSVIKHYSAAIEMYRSAVRLDPYLSEEPELLVDVRLAIAARDAVDDGLDFALHELGAHGADIIYDVYMDHLGQAGMTPVVARAMRVARSDALTEHATPELKVAMQLQEAKYCAEYRQILPAAAEHADTRSLRKLKALQLTRGCGRSGQKDCFVCLRKEGVPLEAAVQRAESHPAPAFLTAREKAQPR